MPIDISKRARRVSEKQTEPDPMEAEQEIHAHQHQQSQERKKQKQRQQQQQQITHPALSRRRLDAALQHSRTDPTLEKEKMSQEILNKNLNTYESTHRVSDEEKETPSESYSGNGISSQTNQFDNQEYKPCANDRSSSLKGTRSDSHVSHHVKRNKTQLGLEEGHTDRMSTNHLVKQNVRCPKRQLRPTKTLLSKAGMDENANILLDSYVSSLLSENATPEIVTASLRHLHSNTASSRRIKKDGSTSAPYLKYDLNMSSGANKQAMQIARRKEYQRGQVQILRAQISELIHSVGDAARPSINSKRTATLSHRPKTRKPVSNVHKRVPLDRKLKELEAQTERLESGVVDVDVKNVLLSNRNNFSLVNKGRPHSAKMRNKKSMSCGHKSIGNSNCNCNGSIQGCNRFTGRESGNGSIYNFRKACGAKNNEDEEECNGYFARAETARALLPLSARARLISDEHLCDEGPCAIDYVSHKNDMMSDEKFTKITGLGSAERFRKVSIQTKLLQQLTKGNVAPSHFSNGEFMCFLRHQFSTECEKEFECSCTKSGQVTSSNPTVLAKGISRVSSRTRETNESDGGYISSDAEGTYEFEFQTDSYAEEGEPSPISNTADASNGPIGANSILPESGDGSNIFPKGDSVDVESNSDVDGGDSEIVGGIRNIDPYRSNGSIGVDGANGFVGGADGNGTVSIGDLTGFGGGVETASETVTTIDGVCNGTIGAGNMSKQPSDVDDSRSIDVDAGIGSIGEYSDDGRGIDGEGNNREGVESLALLNNNNNIVVDDIAEFDDIFFGGAIEDVEEEEEQQQQQHQHQEFLNDTKVPNHIEALTANVIESTPSQSKEHELTIQPKLNNERAQVLSATPHDLKNERIGNKDGQQEEGRSLTQSEPNNDAAAIGDQQKTMLTQSLPAEFDEESVY